MDKYSFSALLLDVSLLFFGGKFYPNKLLIEISEICGFTLAMLEFWLFVKQHFMYLGMGCDDL